MEKLTLPITDKLIVVSALNIEKGLQDGIGKASDYAVIRSGIELDRFGHPHATHSASTRQALGIPLISRRWDRDPLIAAKSAVGFCARGRHRGASATRNLFCHGG